MTNWSQHLNREDSLADVTIYHNPRCSKSRQTLELLQKRGVEPTIVEYLKTPPDVQTLSRLIDQLGIQPADLLRKKEIEFEELYLEDKLHDRDALIDAMVEYPVLIERPIVVSGDRACLGRPPEQIIEII